MIHTQKLFLPIFLLILPVMGFAKPDTLKVKAINELPFGRLNQTVTLSANQLKPLEINNDLKRIHIETAAGRDLLCQPVDTNGDSHLDELIFQADFGPRQTRYFYVYVGERQIYNPTQYKAYGRFVRERYGDFAWENDRIADRIYGGALESSLTSSTVDVWVKSTSKLVINDWYMTDHYHIDTGEGGDLYRAGTSRGVGGDGIWAGGQLWVSKNHVDSHVLSNGPIQILFKLMYAPFDVNGNSIKNPEKIALNAGQNLNHFTIFYKTDRHTQLIAGTGIEKTNLTADEVRQGIPLNHEKLPIERTPGGFTKKDINAKNGWITTQQPLSEGKLYCAIIVSPEQFLKVTEDKRNELVLAKVPKNHIFSYWAGYAWSWSGQFEDYKAWKAYIAHFAKGLQSPIQVSILTAEKGINKLKY
jgi:hypothetical protein